MSNPCGCVPASFVAVGQTEAGWLKRCDEHKRQDLRAALKASAAAGWEHFELGGNGASLDIDGALAVIERGARIDRRKAALSV